MRDTSTRPFPNGPTEMRRTLVAFQRDPLKFHQDLHAQYGALAYFKFGSVHYFSTTDPDIIRTCLVDSAGIMRRTDTTWDTLGRFLGEGLLVSHGSLHRQRRSTLQPLFTPAWVNTYSETMRRNVQHMLAGWRDGETRDLLQEFSLLTQHIALETLFGLTATAVPELTQATTEVIDGIQRYSRERIRRGVSSMSEAEVQAVVSAVDRVMETVITYRRQHGGQDMLSLLLAARDEQGNPLSDTAILDEALSLFVAGQETTSNAIAWACYLLTQHEAVYRQLQTEIRKVIASEPFTPDHLAQMPYLDRVIRETLRLYPPAWIISRTPLSNIEIGGYHFEPGDFIVMCVYAIQRNPAFFPDPQRFDPDRFLQDIPKYSYLPFGGGSHICIGQPFGMLEIAVTLVTMLQEWRLEWAGDAPLHAEPMMTLIPQPSLMVRLTALSAMNT